MEFKGTKGLFTYSVQKGSKNNCFMAQVFNDKGKSIAEIESTDNPEEATANAKLFSKAPEMLLEMEKFCNRVEKGEVRSVNTYNKFKKLIKEATE